MMSVEALQAAIVRRLESADRIGSARGAHERRRHIFAAVLDELRGRGLSRWEAAAIVTDAKDVYELQKK